jgi:hypothetical protein
MPPPQAAQEGCCVRAGDRLLVEGSTSVPDFQLKITWRVALPNGEFVNNQYILHPPSDRSDFREFIPLPAGCLCGLSLSDAEYFACFGQAWFAARLVSGSDTDFQVHQTLAAGHVSAQCSPGYKNGETGSPLNGPGHNIQFELDSPAIGANFDHTGDGSILWKIREIRFRLTTSAAVANRFARVSVANWLGQENILVPSQVQTAGTTVDYVFQRGLNYISPAASMIFGNIPQDLVFAGQGHIKSLVSNLQAGDQLLSIFFAVEEYLYLC